MTPEQERTVRNERIKLLAQAFDRASTACVLAGIISPVALGTPATALSYLAWIGAGVGLHLLARAVLGGLR